MKILYIIISGLAGQGGHLYSCRTIAEAYQEKNKADVIHLCCLGAESPVISNSALPVFNISLLSQGVVKAFLEFLKLIAKEQYDLLHAYDTLSFVFANIAAFFFKKKCLMTLCGGPNPSKTGQSRARVFSSGAGRQGLSFFQDL